MTSHYPDDVACVDVIDAEGGSAGDLGGHAGAGDDSGQCDDRHDERAAHGDSVSSAQRQRARALKGKMRVAHPMAHFGIQLTKKATRFEPGRPFETTTKELQ
jgi:hypothetical protein